MKILVFGLGALGTVYSCLLKNQGHTVLGIDHPAVVEKIKQRGVKVNGIWGNYAASLDQVEARVSDLADRDFDLVILTVKAFDTATAAGQVATLLSSGGFLLLAQNGFGNYETAAGFVPKDRIIVGRVIFGAETLEAGISKVTVIADDVILGSPEKLIATPVLEDLAVMFTTAGIPTRISDSIMQYVWGKIIYNSALNPLGAILEVNYGRLAEMDTTRQLMDAMIEEIFAVLEAMGQPVPWSDAAEYKTAFYGQMIPSTAGHHASMLQDIQRGRPTEIDALNGAVVELGSIYGVDTPVNRVITSLLKARENLLQPATSSQ